jgi:hypothetical protein
MSQFPHSRQPHSKQPLARRHLLYPQIYCNLEQKALPFESHLGRPRAGTRESLHSPAYRRSGRTQRQHSAVKLRHAYWSERRRMRSRDQRTTPHTNYLFNFPAAIDEYFRLGNMKFLSLRHSTKKSLNEEGKTLVFLKNGHKILISNKNT